MGEVTHRVLFDGKYGLFANRKAVHHCIGRFTESINMWREKLYSVGKIQDKLADVEDLYNKRKGIYLVPLTYEEIELISAAISVYDGYILESEHQLQASRQELEQFLIDVPVEEGEDV